MATYKPVSRSVPSAERSTVITDVAAGDTINLIDVLGRPARGLIVSADNSADVVEYRLNNRKVVTVIPPAEQERNAAAIAFGGKEDDVSEVEVWERSEAFPTFTTTGASWQTVEGLTISSIDIVSITGPATITIVAF
jgi:hypothetical protein